MGWLRGKFEFLGGAARALLLPLMGWLCLNPFEKKTDVCQGNGVPAISGERRSNFLQSLSAVPNCATSVLHHSELVIPCCGDVPHPWQRLIAAALDDLEVPDLRATPGRAQVSLLTFVAPKPRYFWLT